MDTMVWRQAMAHVNRFELYSQNYPPGSTIYRSLVTAELMVVEDWNPEGNGRYYWRSNLPTRLPNNWERVKVSDIDAAKLYVELRMSRG